MRRVSEHSVARTHPETTLALPPARAGTLFGVGVIVFLANAALLVLQLVAGRLVAPFVGSSLETWTAIIAAFLAGITLGNAFGGRIADAAPARWKLAVFLAAGAVAALWMIALPEILHATDFQRHIPLRLRIPLLAGVLCFPAAFALSLITPLAVKLGTPDVRSAGRAAGSVFALGTLGCLVGNYVTGFYLIPSLTVNGIVTWTTGLLLLLALFTLGSSWGRRRERAAVGGDPPPVEHPTANGFATHNGSWAHASTSHTHPPAAGRLPIPIAFAIVFLASFSGMTLELTASRLLAQILGVSLYTWTGVIGVMLAGTAAGNWIGGVLADRAGRSTDPHAGADRLSACLTAAAASAVVLLLTFFVGNSEFAKGSPVINAVLHESGLVTRVLVWTFLLFFVPMFLLGTVSPQVIRLAVPDAAHAGRVAGRVYAISTAGAIAGSFAAGFVLMSTLGMYRTVLLAAVLPATAAVAMGRVWQRPPILYVLSATAGIVLFEFVLLSPSATKITRETNYYTITVRPEPEPQLRPFGFALAPLAVAGPAGLFDPPGTVLQLQLDMLVHSWVKPTDPTYLRYLHEQTQMELLRAVADDNPAGPNVLVIGGGGYTFPRAARTIVPSSTVDVVEIDPGVTTISYSHLALDSALGIRSYHMDGRQFVAEQATPGHYDLVTLDAVNDLTVPYHLLTREFNEAVKRALAPKGVYLLTVIDILEDGKLWRSAVHTLRQTFPHVEVLSSHPREDRVKQQVYVIYASDEPFDLNRLFASVDRHWQREAVTDAVHEEVGTESGDPVILTDQYAPVDNLMADVFRRRKD